MATVHLRGWPPLQVLTYFQPRVVLQLSQKMSATEWSPVSRRRCSAGPQPTLTLSQETRRNPAPVESFCQFSPQTARRNFHLESAEPAPLEAPAGRTPPRGD